VRPDGTTRLRSAATVVHLGRHPVRTSVVGDGPPLLLCNGLASPIEAWGPLVDELPGFRIIAFDAPGVGDSPAPTRPITIGTVARLATEVLDHAGVTRAHVLGYSWGGAVAQHLAWRHAARVDRLVLASASAGMGSVPGVPLALAPLLVSMLHPDNPRRARTSPLGFLTQIGAIGSWTSLPWLHKVAARTLVVHGGADYAVPAINAHVLAWGLRDARLELLPRADHLVFEPRSVGRIAASVRTFLTAA
jgi:pimeloyl-ACP methyl ester carboxylesterase